MVLQIDRDSFQESLFAYIVQEHAENCEKTPVKRYDQIWTGTGLTRGGLRVRQPIEYLTSGLELAERELWTKPHLVDEIRVGAFDLNWVGGALRIQYEGSIAVRRDEVGSDLPFWEDSGTLFFNPACLKL
jgi:hypothetical protein